MELSSFFSPGLVGFHCIGLDPYYLTFKSEMLGYKPEVALAGRNILPTVFHYGLPIELLITRKSACMNWWFMPTTSRPHLNKIVLISEIQEFLALKML